MRVPWLCVKKTWSTRRQAWLSSVQTSHDCDNIAKLLLRFEGALKQDVFSPNWGKYAEAWRAQLGAERQSGAQVEAALDQLEGAIEWERILATPQMSGVPVPSELDESLRCPPDGMPQVAVRMLLLLRSMGVRKFSPGVVVQLLEAMQAYTADVLNDAATYQRFRTLGASSASDSRARQQNRPPQPFKFDDHPPHSTAGPAASSTEADIELSDLLLAVRAPCARVHARV